LGRPTATAQPRPTPTGSPSSPALAQVATPGRPPPPVTRLAGRQPPTHSPSLHVAPLSRPTPIFFLDAARAPVLFFFFLRFEPPTAATQLQCQSSPSVGSHGRQPRLCARTTLSFSGREPPPSSTTLRSSPSVLSRRPRTLMSRPPHLHSLDPFW
jgi:hypothetical protein